MSEDKRIKMEKSKLEIQGEPFNGTLFIPKAVGEIVIANTLHFEIHKKPRWFHLVMMRWFFGFKYISHGIGRSKG